MNNKKNFSIIKRFAFTLPEVLITLVIIGIIAVLTLPSLIDNVSNRTMTTQIKNMTLVIQQLAADQLLVNKTSNLQITDFSSADKLFTSRNFSYAKRCGESETGCWASDYRNLNSASVTIDTTPAVILKNSAVISYQRVNETTTDNESVIGYFIADVNGQESPNMVGRDVFAFYITSKGRIVYETEIDHDNEDELNSTQKCKEGDGGYCLALVVENNWKMPY